MWTDHRELSDPKRAVQLGVGLASPLWPTFFLAASAGAVYWAWSQWARRPELAGEAGPAAVPTPTRRKPAVVAAPEPVTEVAPEPEALDVEAAPEPLAEIASEPEVVPEPAPAPVVASPPVVEAAPAPKLRPKAPRKPKAMAAPAVEAPVVTAPVVETPVVEAVASEPKPVRKGKGGGARKGKVGARSPRASVRRKAHRPQA